MICTRILLIALLSIHIQAPAMENFFSNAATLVDRFFNAADDSDDSDAEAAPEPDDSDDSDAEAAPEPKDPFSDLFGKSRAYKNELWKLCCECDHNNEEKLTPQIAALINSGKYDINEKEGDHEDRSLLHIAVGNRSVMLTELLLTAGANINAQEKFAGDTPLHKVCRHHGYEKLIGILLQSPIINANIKNKQGDRPICCCLNNSFLEIHRKHIIVNLLIDSKKIDLNKKNNHKETFFYRWVSHYSNQNYDKFPLNFITQFSEQERKTFATQELHHAATICSSDPESGLNKFVDRCLELGGDINHRNPKGQRPMEVAAEQYMYATKCLIDTDQSFRTKQKIYYYFLKEAPYVYDEEIRERLKQKGLIDDFVKKIMGYYTALITVDRICVLQSNWYFSSPRFSKKDKKEILNKICNNLGYINPMIKKQPLDFPKIMN